MFCIACGWVRTSPGPSDWIMSVDTAAASMRPLQGMSDVDWSARILALIGAVTGLTALVWNIVSSRHDRGRLRVDCWINTYADPVDPPLRKLQINFTNEGKRPAQPALLWGKRGFRRWLAISFSGAPRLDEAQIWRDTWDPGQILISFEGWPKRLRVTDSQRRRSRVRHSAKLLRELETDVGVTRRSTA
jgi:hypothetical protein